MFDRQRCRQLALERRQRQVDMKRAAAQGLALKRHRAMVQRHQTARDRQAQADPFAAPLVLLQGCEWLKDTLLQLGRNAGAGIPHPDMQVRRRDLGAQRDLPVLGELARVAQQVQQNLA